MANVTITIPDTLVARLSTALRAAYPQYAAMTDLQAFKAATADHWRLVLAQAEEAAAVSTAAASVATAGADARAKANADSAGIG